MVKPALVHVQDTDARLRLWNIISEKSFSRGTFKLSSGKISDYFFNLKQTMLDPEGANLLAEFVLKFMEERDLHYVGGLEMGAVPLVVAVCTKSFQRYPVNTFIVRKQAKQHGAMELIDGHIKRDSEVLIVDDVVTTGQSILQAVRAARDQGCKVPTVWAIVDRLEGGRERLTKEGLDLVALFKRSDFF